MPNEVNEDPEFVKRSLYELDCEVAKISRNTAYEKAALQNPEYLQARAFKLGFLRADCFDPAKAAHRIVRYLEEKLSIFGPNLLTEDIRMDDLNENDVKVLSSGCLQWLPIRDRLGRPILFICPQLQPDGCPFESMMRVALYMLSLMDDLEAQRKGHVALFYVVGQSPNVIKDQRERWDMPRLQGSCPLRTACVHFCLDNPIFQSLMSLAMYALGQETRCRTQTHFGMFAFFRNSVFLWGTGAIRADPAMLSRIRCRDTC